LLVYLLGNNSLPKKKPIKLFSTQLFLKIKSTFKLSSTGFSFIEFYLMVGYDVLDPLYMIYFLAMHINVQSIVGSFSFFFYFFR